MGQRLQGFIYCLNPTSALKERYKSLKKYNGNKDEASQLQSKIIQYEEAFGKGPHTVIAFHHQWLYGRSSLIAASNIIDFNQNCPKESNPFCSQTDITGDEYLSLLTHLLGLFKTKLAKVIGRFGVEPFRLLNFIEPYMRKNCASGDNNDGIFIIDCVNDCYCFSNVGSGDSTISQMRVLTPLSAEQYVRLYYPITLTDSNTANIPDSTEEQIEYFNNNRRLNKLFTKTFESYRLMTQSELKKMFPAAFQNETTSEIKTNNEIKK